MAGEPTPVLPACEPEERVYVQRFRFVGVARKELPLVTTSSLGSPKPATIAGYIFTGGNAGQQTKHKEEKGSWKLSH